MASAVKFSRVCRLFQQFASVASSKNTVFRPDSRQFHTSIVTENISCWRWKQYDNKRFLQSLPADRIKRPPSSLSHMNTFKSVRDEVISENVFNKRRLGWLLGLLKRGEMPLSQNDLDGGTLKWRSSFFKNGLFDAINEFEADILLHSTGKLNRYTPAAKRAEYTRLIWDKLQELGSVEVKNSVRFYNIYLKMLLENQVAVIPSDVLEDMAARQLRPDRESYHLLIASACERGDMETARDLLSEMKLLEMESSIDLYNSFVRGYCKAGDTDKAMEMFGFICSHNIKPNGETFANLLIGYAAQADIDNVKEVLRKADEAGVEIDKWKSLESVKILADARQTHLAHKVLSLLLDGEILSSSAHLINLMVSLVDSGHARLAFHLFGKATNENPDVNQLRQFYRSAVGANMEVSILIKFLRKFRMLGYEEGTVKDVIKEANMQGETEYAVELYKHLEKEGECADANCLIPAIMKAAIDEDHEGVRKLIQMAGMMDIWAFRNFIKKAYPSIRKMTKSSEEAVKILKEANPVDVEEWNSAMIHSLLVNSTYMDDAEREVEHMEKLKSPLGSYLLMEGLAYQMNYCDRWKRVYEFALKLRDKSEWYMDFFPLFQETYYVFLEAKKSLDPVVDFMIENDIKIRSRGSQFDMLFPNTDLTKEKKEQFMDTTPYSIYPRRNFPGGPGGEVKEAMVPEGYQKFPYHLSEIQPYLMEKAVSEKNKRDIQALLRLNPARDAKYWNLSFEELKVLISLCCLSDVDAAFRHYQYLQKYTRSVASMQPDPTASLAIGLCKKGRFGDALYVIQNPKRRVGQGLMSRQKIELLLEAAQSNKQKQLLDKALTSNNYYKSSSDVLDEKSEERLKTLQRKQFFPIFRQLIQAQNTEELQRVTDILCRHNERDEVLHQLAAAFITEQKILQARKTFQTSGPLQLNEVKEICRSIDPLPNSKSVLKSLYALMTGGHKRSAVMGNRDKGSPQTAKLCIDEVQFHIVRKIARTESLDKAADYVQELAMSNVPINYGTQNFLRNLFISDEKPIPTILIDTQLRSPNQKQMDAQRKQVEDVSDLSDPGTVADIVEKEEEIKDVAEQRKKVKDVTDLSDPETVADIVEKEEEIEDIAEQFDSATEIIEQLEPVNETVKKPESALSHFDH